MKYSQLQRFHLIDSLLYLNAEGMSTKDMLEKVNASLAGNQLSRITLRQLQKDLKDMKDLLDAPISSGRGQRMVRYDDLGFCIFSRTRESYRTDRGEDALPGRLEWLGLQVDYMQESKRA